MRRLGETLFFVAVALGLHVLMAMRGLDDGGDTDGASGDAFISITGAPATIETVLADWTAAPTHQAQMTAELDQPDLDVSDAPLPSLTLDSAPNTDIKIAALAPTEVPQQPDLDLARAPLPPQPVMAAPAMPTLSAPSEAQPPELQPAAMPSVVPPKQPSMEPPTPVMDNSIESPEPPPKLPPEPVEEPVEEPKPEPKPPVKQAAKPEPKKQVADKAQAASAGATAQKAAGSGKSNKAGSSKKSSAAGKGKQASEFAVWKGKIQSRVARGVRSNHRGAPKRMVVAIQVAVNGRIQGVSVVKSSGDASVDQAVVKSVRRIGRFAKAPKGLPKPHYVFRLGVNLD